MFSLRFGEAEREKLCRVEVFARGKWPAMSRHATTSSHLAVLSGHSKTVTWLWVDKRDVVVMYALEIGGSQNKYCLGRC